MESAAIFLLPCSRFRSDSSTLDGRLNPRLVVGGPVERETVGSSALSNPREASLNSFLRDAVADLCLAIARTLADEGRPLQSTPWRGRGRAAYC
jgi:hypothetical protein